LLFSPYSNKFDVLALLAQIFFMRFILFLFCFYSLSMNAQIGTGEWRLHVPARKAIDVAAGDNKVYAAFESGILEYDVNDDEKRLWTDVNGLSDISPTSLLFSAASNSLFIGYDNGNFDKLKDGQVINIPAIKLAQVQGSKRINKIVEYNNFIYLATGFAVVKIDPAKNEVKDTYYPTSGNEAIMDIVFRNDSIFALSTSRLYRGFLNNVALADASQWTVDTRLPVEITHGYSDLENVDDELFVTYKNANYGMDSVFKIKNEGLELLTDVSFTLEIKSLSVHDGLLAVNADGGTFVYNSDGSLANLINNYSYGAYPNINNSIYANGFVWLADEREGLVRYFSEFSSLKITFDGPPKKDFYSMDWQDGRLVVAGGGLSSIFVTFNGSGIYLFEDEKWTLRDRDNMQMWNGEMVWDFLSTAINPLDKEQIAVGTFSEIPLSIMNSTGQVVDTFSPANSTLEYSSSGGQMSMISGLGYDEDENLWMANAYSDQPLNVRTKSGLWYSFDCGTAAKNKFTRKLIIDYNGHKWFAADGAGVFGYKDNGTIEDPSDDDRVNLNTGENTGNLPSNTVTALAVDFDNEVWIGTDNGFAVLYNSDGAFDAAAGGYNAQRIKLEFEGNVEYVLGNTAITDIEVDGGNRKWIGTANSGIILLSPDGLQILEQHTTEILR
jgi:ligand-binding sensor domain-containing protein